MVQAAYNGLPMSLDQCAKVLGSEAKDKAGTALIRYFSMPCKPTKANGGRTRNLPEHDPEKWEAFKRYCAQDVAAERAIAQRLAPIPDDEQALWCLDQRINDRGILVDEEMLAQAVIMDRINRERLIDEAKRITGLDNPNSAAQLKALLEANGMEVESLRKDNLPDLVRFAPDEQIERMLRIRQELSKTSVKKYQAMAEYVCADGRIRGLFQFYGAGRTGRWAGRGVQMQNLPRNHMNDLDIARQLVREGDAEMLGLLFSEPLPDIHSQLIRTAFVAPEGSTLLVADFSAIEARVIAWLAGEQWRLDVFNTHGKIYEASAAQMFKVPIETIAKGSDLRQKGKVAELALGYQGGPNALIAMGALDMGLKEEELPGLVKMWRNANRSGSWSCGTERWKALPGYEIEQLETLMMPVTPSIYGL
jgi:DNA polymerase